MHRHLHNLAQFFVLLALGGCGESSVESNTDSGPEALEPCTLSAHCPRQSAYACVGTTCGGDWFCEAGTCGGALTTHCGCDGLLYQASTCANRPSQPLSECPPVDCEGGNVTCDAAAPECTGSRVPSVHEGCWGPCVIPEQCR